MEMIEKYEVLAPAGSIENLKKMIKANPDAIYVGYEGFSSRPQFSDMSLDSIKEAVKICHSNNIKTYVAINANVMHSQMEGLIEDIMRMDEMMVDAVIISEFGLVKRLSGCLKHAQIHSSTLMGVYNIETVKMLKKAGVSRIIFYANLYFDEMAAITQAVPDLDYELVAEGGTCFNDIRQCHLPHSYQEDEHRLFCRANYKLINAIDPKNFSLAREISEHPTRIAEVVALYMAIGIKSFKIEGRTLPAEDRIPMVNDLKKYIEMFEQRGAMKAYLHYFYRSTTEMR